MWFISTVAKCWKGVETFPALQPCVNSESSNRVFWGFCCRSHLNRIFFPNQNTKTSDKNFIISLIVLPGKYVISSILQILLYTDLRYSHCLFDIVLYIQLSSIPGLEDVKFEVSSANMNSVTNGPVAQGTMDQETAVSPQSGVSKDA